MIQKLRVSSLILIHILILLHIFYWGDEKIGSIDFQEFFHSFIKLGTINAGVLLVIIAFFFTLIFGRFFCGWACHFGAVQELAWLFLKKMNIQPKTIDSKLVTFLPLLILLHLYVLNNFFFAINLPWEMSIKINEPNIWEFLPGYIIGTLTFIIDGFLIIYFLGRKGFCRFICPWGAFLKIPNSLALFKVRKTGNCTNCYNCTASCPVGIDVNYEINNYKKVTNTNCTSCMMCISGCPSNALSYTYENPLKEKINLTHYLPTNHKINEINNKKDYFKSIRSLDWLYLLLIFIFANSITNMYGIGDFLAYGIAIIGAFIIIGNNIKSKIVKYGINTLIILFFFWHIIIKMNIYMGSHNYKYDNPSILEKTIRIYAQKMNSHK